MRILFVGPQGSGKSTQGKLLAGYLQVPYISTGDIFRKIALEETELGLRVRELLDKGLLVNDQTVAEIVEERLQDADCEQGVILDGYPRSLTQIELFDPKFNLVFYLKLESDQATQRLLSRGRKDDTSELIAQRLKLYHERTDPIINYYEQQGILHTIDASGQIELIQEQIRKIVNG